MIHSNFSSSQNISHEKLNVLKHNFPLRCFIFFHYFYFFFIINQSQTTGKSHNIFIFLIFMIMYENRATGKTHLS